MLAQALPDVNLLGTSYAALLHDLTMLTSCLTSPSEIRTATAHSYKSKYFQTHITPMKLGRNGLPAPYLMEDS